MARLPAPEAHEVLAVLHGQDVGVVGRPRPLGLTEIVQDIQNARAQAAGGSPSWMTRNGRVADEYRISRTGAERVIESLVADGLAVPYAIGDRILPGDVDSRPTPAYGMPAGASTLYAADAWRTVVANEIERINLKRRKQATLLALDDLREAYREEFDRLLASHLTLIEPQP